MKPLSLARQHFDRLIQDGCIYVDKTQQIHRLVSHYSHVFMARPRRFGKSLLLSTMAHLFAGRTDLFRGLWIEDNWDWGQDWPVIRFLSIKPILKRANRD